MEETERRKGMSKKEKKVSKKAEKLSLIPHQPAVVSIPGLEVESDIVFEMDPDTGAPVVWHGTFINRSDEPAAQADVQIDRLFDRLIEANTVPGPSACPRHREALNACLDRWAEAVERARAKVALVPDWQDPSLRDESPAKTKKHKRK